MDKNILDALIKYGFVTNIDVDPNKYKDVDELINKGIITIPGAKSRIMELLENAGIKTIDVAPKTNETDIIIEVKDDEPVTVTDTPEDVTPIDETPESPEVIDETPVEETPIDETPTEEPTVNEEAVAEEVAETVEETPKKKKTTKKTEQAE